MPGSKTRTTRIDTRSTKKAWIICNAEGCRHLKDGHCSLDEIHIDVKTKSCVSAEYSCICDTCAEGKARECPHAAGKHYDVYGEGIEPPDWCPQHSNELPF